MNKKVYNIYCDESCHILNDNNNKMTLGALYLDKDSVRDISMDIRDIKEKYKCTNELKWTKVSPKNIDFYLELVNYFFSKPSLAFRVIIIDKGKLNHEKFNNGSHDLFYYKMYYELLKYIIHNSSYGYNIYLDIKDTNTSEKAFELKKVLLNKFKDSTSERLKKIQQIRSHESNLLQLCDFFLGAVTYKNRNINTSSAKLAVIKEIEKRSINLGKQNYNKKFNIFKIQLGKNND